MSRGMKLGLTLVIVALAASTANAELLRGGVVSSGGHTSSGGGLVLQGTVGQAAVGGSAGTSFFACHGFWCFGGSRVVSVTFDPKDPQVTAGLPKSLELSPPFPNPSHGSVRFNLALPQDADVTFTVLDVAGRQIGETVRERLVAGRHELKWTAPALNAGVYFGQLVVEGAQPMKRRIVLIR
jgi:hypothetical protein